MADEDNPADAPEEAKGGKMKLIIFGVIGVALLGVGAFVGMTMMAAPDEEATEVAEAPSGGPPIYQTLHPPLVVNFKDAAGDSHYMQITMEVMSRKQSAVNAVRDNLAVIRNALILLYSGAVYEEVTTREGKEQMLADGLAEIERVMVETTGEGGVEALYFTSLVIQ